MLPYLPAFCNSYLHHSGRRRLRLVAPPHPRKCPRASCIHADVPRMPDATTTPRPVHRAPVRCSASPRPGSRPDTLAFPWMLASLALPPAVARLLWWGFSAWQRTPPARDQKDMVWGAAPLYLEEKYLWTLGRSPLGPWGERPLDLLAQCPWTSGRSPLYLREKSLVPWGEIA
jgi:hypothetical protein